MTDTRTQDQRSKIMQSVRTRDTGPELVVRRLLYQLGYRFRLHAKHLPGRPDIVLPGKKCAIFVHGCFWHSHGCPKGQAPKSRLEYWGPKLEANRSRDHAQSTALESLGWKVLTIWQCETTDRESLATKVSKFIDGRVRSSGEKIR
jgi:DNA mismatch endonuclease (patch repair protein)